MNGGTRNLMEPRNGDDFSGTDRFDVRRRVGAGGMGAVYEAYDRDRDMRVAIKTILNADASLLYRFKKEFRSLSDVSHPNLVKLYELILLENQCFYTMEFIEGVDFIRFVCPANALSPEDPLSDTAESYAVLDTTHLTGEPGSAGVSTDIDPSPSREESAGAIGSTCEAVDSTSTVVPLGEGPPSGNDSATTQAQSRPADSSGEAAGDAADPRGTRPAEPPSFHGVRLRAALRQLGEAVNILHAMGKLHRDIKPSNVLVTRRGRVVLLDFGLSTEMEGREEHQSTTHGHVVGTAAYMAPEQAGGDPLSPASDWYSVGVMLYRALTGKLPFAGKSLDVMMKKQLVDPPEPRTINPAVPDELNDLCVDLLKREPGARPTGDEVLQRLGGPGGGPSSPAAAGSGPRSRLFVGREQQLGALAESFTAVRRGQTSAVFVHGRSGAGKSTLLQRFLDELVERGEAVVLGGRCYEQESVAYKAIDTLIDSLTRFLRRLHRHEAEGLMPRDVAALARVFPVLRRVDAVAESPKRPTDIQDPQELRRRAFGALRELLARIGDRKPMVLAIDDLQWGDVDSAALLCELLQPPDPPLLLLACAYRSEYATHSPCLRMLLDPAVSGLPPDRRREIAVDALSRDESCELAIRLLGHDDEVARKQARMIARESRGSPYFVYELVEHLNAGGELEDRSQFTGSISLDDVLWARIQRLPENARDLLEVLAVAGRPLRQADATRATGLGPAGFTALASLRSDHLVRGTGAGALDDVETYHDRIREIVAGRLAPERLKSWHERLAAELEASGRADAETLAIHFDAAEQPGKAGTYYIQAAREATEALAFDRASTLFRRALELAAGTEPEHALRRSLADALAYAGRSHEAAQEYLRTCEDAGPAELQELRRALAFQLLMSGRIDEGLAVYRDVLAHFGLRMPATPRQALHEMIVTRAILWFRGLGFRERPASEVPPAVLERVDTAQAVALGMTVVDWIRGSSFQSRSLLMALRAGEPLRIALSMGWEVVPSACGGKPARRRTRRLIRKAGALSERLGDPHAIGMAKLGHGAAEFLSSRFRPGVAISDEATAIIRERCPGAVWELDTSQIFAAWSLFYCGDINELRTRCPRMAKEARERGDRYLETTVNQFPRVVTLLADDDPDQGRHHSLESISKWSQQGFHVQHLTSFYGQMLTDLYKGDGRGAWRRFLSTRPDVESSLLLKIQHVDIDYLQYSGRVALAAARQAQSSVEAEPLLAHARGAARKLDRQGLRWSRAFASLVRGGIASIRGDESMASARLRESIDGLDEVGLLLYAAAARHKLGQLLGGDEGRALIARSDAWMAEQGIRAPEKMVRACVSGFPE
jgi:serine/threonine protein kinase/tetratricopeptide (TPR) repeat protein